MKLTMVAMKSPESSIAFSIELAPLAAFLNRSCVIGAAPNDEKP